MSIKKMTSAAAIALTLSFASIANAGAINDGSVDHVTAETNPAVFGIEQKPSATNFANNQYDHVITETRPDVFGKYKPQGWEETGKADLEGLRNQGG